MDSNCNLRFNLSNLSTIMLRVMHMGIALATKAYSSIEIAIWCLTCSSGWIYTIFNRMNDINANIRGTASSVVNRSDITSTGINSASFACHAVAVSIGVSYLALKTVELTQFTANSAITLIVFDIVDPIHVILGDLTCFAINFNDNTSWFEFMCAIAVEVLMQNEIKLLIMAFVWYIGSGVHNHSRTEMICTEWIVSIADTADNLCPKTKHLCAMMQRLCIMDVLYTWYELSQCWK